MAACSAFLKLGCWCSKQPGDHPAPERQVVEQGWLDPTRFLDGVAIGQIYWTGRSHEQLCRVIKPDWLTRSISVAQRLCWRLLQVFCSSWWAHSSAIATAPRSNLRGLTAGVPGAWATAAVDADRPRAGHR